MSSCFLGNPPEKVVKWIKQHHNCLCFTAQENGFEVTMINQDFEIPTTFNLQISYDNKLWQDWDFSIIELNSGEKVWFRAPASGNEGISTSRNNINMFYTNQKKFAASGNVMSLLDQSMTRSDVSPYCFYGLLFGMDYELEINTGLTHAPILPASMLAPSCYEFMFNGCFQLSAAPALPATQLAESCYSSMFEDCTSLTVAPELPATQLADYCYSYMFYNCSSLTAAPALPATQLADSCYGSMFRNCTKLSSIDVNFTTWSPSTATLNWVSNVASSGTFTCLASLPQTRGRNYIPSNWTIVTK